MTDPRWFADVRREKPIVTVSWRHKSNPREGTTNSEAIFGLIIGFIDHIAMHECDDPMISIEIEAYTATIPGKIVEFDEEAWLSELRDNNDYELAAVSRGSLNGMPKGSIKATYTFLIRKPRDSVEP